MIYLNGNLLINNLLIIVFLKRLDNSLKNIFSFTFYCLNFFNIVSAGQKMLHTTVEVLYLVLK